MASSPDLPTMATIGASDDEEQQGGDAERVTTPSRLQRAGGPAETQRLVVTAVSTPMTTREQADDGRRERHRRGDEDAQS